MLEKDPPADKNAKAHKHLFQLVPDYHERMLMNSVLPLKIGSP